MIGCLFDLHDRREVEPLEFGISWATHTCRNCGLSFNKVAGGYRLTTDLSPSERERSWRKFKGET